MRNFFMASSVVAIVAGCNNEAGKSNTRDTVNQVTTTNTKQNSLDEAQQKDGWQLLFDGESLKGWHKYGGKPAGKAWKVSNGELTLDTSVKKDWQILDGGDIVTDEEYENFHLKLEWKISENGNSGIMFYSNEDSTKYKYPWETAPEMQILHNDGHADGKIAKHRAGDLYDLISVSKETVKPVGEWNQVEIKAMNGKLDLWLNGENVISTMLWDDNWKKLVAGSKFKNHPDFATYKKGRIGLQDHGNAVWFRNIRIKKL